MGVWVYTYIVERARDKRKEITTMKYNKSEIMKAAWNLYRTNFSRFFGKCLSKAWALAKAAANKEAFTGYTTFNGFDFRFWSNYGKRRIYVTGYRKQYSGYIDLDDGNVLKGTDYFDTVRTVELFLAHYDIAC